MGRLWDLEKELAARQEDLDVCKQMLSLDPDSADALETIPILEADIADISSKIDAERAKKAAASAPPPPPPAADDASSSSAAAAAPPKFDMSKHPKFRDANSDAPPPPPPPPAAPAEEVQNVFHVGNVVMAKYTADKQWYQATIISKTGSSTDPVYSVTFKGYGNTETNKRKADIRALESSSNNTTNNKKRKADGSTPVAGSLPAPDSPKPKQQGGTVISAAPSIDPDLVNRREPSKVSDGPTRMAPEPKKLKGNKALEKSKSSWNDWQKSGPKKGGLAGTKKMNKESQFRTPDLPGAKVGFTGSGKPMQKDQARAKWNYGGGGNLDE